MKSSMFSRIEGDGGNNKYHDEENFQRMEDSDSASFNAILDELACKKSQEDTLMHEKGIGPDLNTCNKGVKRSSRSGNFFTMVEVEKENEECPFLMIRSQHDVLAMTLGKEGMKGRI